MTYMTIASLVLPIVTFGLYYLSKNTKLLVVIPMLLFLAMYFLGVDLNEYSSEEGNEIFLIFVSFTNNTLYAFFKTNRYIRAVSIILFTIINLPLVAIAATSFFIETGIR